MKMINRRISFSFLLFFLLCLFPPWVIGQEGGIAPGELNTTNPKERTTIVTATVPDTHPPSAPILIAPENNSTHRVTPDFSWYASSDNVGVTEYQLTFNGTILFSDIPVFSMENGQFTLAYDGGTNSYTLDPKSSLPDGTHTWKITALDIRGNATASTTWSFTQDTTAPTFVITEIDGQVTAISSQDVATVPIDPILLENNEPVLSGTGEAHAEVQLTLTWDGGSAEMEFSIGGDGNWESTLPLLPKDTIITLNFLITDQLGNISILEDVQLLLESDSIAVILPPRETDEPFFEIPIPSSPRELVLDLGQQLEELLPQDLRQLAPLPEPIATIVKHSTTALEPVAALLLISVTPVLAVVSLIAPFGANISAQLTQHALYALGYLPNKKNQGMVFEASDQSPVPLAKITLTGETLDGQVVHKTAFSTVDGFYPPFNPEPGTYRVLVERTHFSFPSLEKRPPHLSTENYYQGEQFTIDTQHPEPGLLIPLERISPESKWDTAHGQLLLAQLSQYREVFGALSWVVLATTTALYPSFINAVTLGSFSMIVLLRYVVFTRLLSGVTISSDNEPIRNVIIKALNSRTGVVENITQSQRKGRFWLGKVDRELSLIVVDAGRKWTEKDSKEAHAALQANPSQRLVLILERVEYPVV